MGVSRRTLVLALALTPGIGGRSITRIMTRNDLLGRGQDEFLRLGEEALREEYRLGAKPAAEWASKASERIADADQLLAKLDGHSVTIVTAADAHYPRRIEAMDSNPPGVLFLYGNVRLLDANTFCVLSSRGSSEQALSLIEKLTEQGVLDAKVLVTGHDTPEYQRAAVVPLRWGAPRVLALDQGFFEAFGEDLKEEPFPAARLWRYEFDPTTDLAVTSIGPEQSYHRNANRMRDRLVATLSQSLDFVCVNKGGNMERLARIALKVGRKVRVSELAEMQDALAALGAARISASVDSVS